MNKNQEPRKGNKRNTLPAAGEVCEVRQTTPALESPDQRQAVLDAWNEMAKSVGARAAIELTPARQRALSARLSNPSWRSRWRDALALIPGRPFLLGAGTRGWRADLDWFLRPDTVTRLLEGGWSDGNGHTPTTTKGYAKHDPDAHRRDPRHGTF